MKLLHLLLFSGVMAMCLKGSQQEATITMYVLQANSSYELREFSAAEIQEMLKTVGYIVSSSPAQSTDKELLWKAHTPLLCFTLPDGTGVGKPLKSFLESMLKLIPSVNFPTSSEQK